MITVILFLAAFSLAASSVDFPFRNTSLSWDARVSDLVIRLTLEEVVLQLSTGTTSAEATRAPAIPRLGIKPYVWSTECLRGDVGAGPATSFPQSIGLAATFDSGVLDRVVRAIGLEIRAKNNNYTKHEVYGNHAGLNCLSPVINIMRHPLWGRNQETYGEDPFLTGELATRFVRNIQGDHPRYLLTNAVCKHWAAYDGPEDKPILRYSFDARVSLRDLQLTFLPQFRRCIEAGAMGVMCSYNALNGVPTCASKWLLNDVLREQWNFTGFIISDLGAFEAMVTNHKSFKTQLDAAVGAINAGCNLEFAPINQDTTYSHLMEAVKRGSIKEARLRELLVPLFYTRFRLGEFDPLAMNPYTQLNASKYVQSEEHRKLSLLAATKSFVLLKNNQLLPLEATYKKIAVVGPFATDMSKMYGDYSSDRMPQYEISVAKGLDALSKQTSVAEVCVDGPLCVHYNSSQLIPAITDAEIVVLTLGTGIDIEAESVDRWNMKLTNGQQRLLLETIEATISSSAPIVLLIFSASPVDIRAAVSSDKVKAIVWCGFPAQSAGQALAEVLMKPREDDHSTWAGIAGRLPFTWYQTSSDLNNITDYYMHNLTYRYYSGLPVFPFGYGLGYSSFRYGNLIIAERVRLREAILLSVTVTNAGGYKSDEVLQVYISWPNEVKDMPIRQLVAFRRVTLASKSRLAANFTIYPEQTQIWSNNRFSPFQGVLLVSVGGQQPDQKTVTSSNVLKATVTITS